MNSPLKFDAETVKEFGIKEFSELDAEVKLGYVRTQLDEIKKAAYRVRVDLIIAQHQAETAEEPHLKNQHEAKVNEQKVLLKQFVASTVVLNDLVKELENDLVKELESTVSE